MPRGFFGDLIFASSLECCGEIILITKDKVSITRNLGVILLVPFSSTFYAMYSKNNYPRNVIHTVLYDYAVQDGSSMI